MSRKARHRASLVIFGVALAAAIHGCSTDRKEGTNTNWHACDVSSDCEPRGAGESVECVGGRCVYADGDTCLPAPAGAKCGADLACPATWEAAQAVALGCRREGQATDVLGVLLRCGALNAIQFDNSNYTAVRYYDASGKFVGYQEHNADHGFCRSFDESFTTVPESCVPLTPPCADAGAGGAPADAAPDPDGRSPEDAPSGDVAAPECDLLPPCDCPNAFETAKAGASRCKPWSPSPTYTYVDRCGGYDVVVTAGLDSGWTNYYDGAGNRVAMYPYGLTTERCEWYGEPFTRPTSCEDPAPFCGPPDAGTPDARGTPDGATGDDASASECLLEPLPCTGGPDCLATFAVARTKAIPCRTSDLDGGLIARCGAFDTYVVVAPRGSGLLFYGTDGVLAGALNITLGVSSCTAYDSSFVEAPTACTILTPTCLPDGAAPPSDGG